MIKKYFLFFLFSCVTIIFAKAQTFQWVKNFGSSVNKEGKSIVVDRYGFIYTAINNTNTATTAGFASFLIKKQNPQGNDIWNVTFSSSGFSLNSTNCQSIAVDLNGNLYITGYHSGIVKYNSTTILTPTNNNFQAFVIKLNTNGGLIWSKSLGDSYETKGVSIALDRNSNVYTTGYCTGFAFGNSAIGRDIFIIKYDSSGNQKWLRKIGGAGIDNPTSISIDLNNNVLTTGYYSDLVDFDPGINSYNLTSNGNDVFVSKLDSSGNFIWAKSLEGDAIERGNSIKVDYQNNIIIGGIFNGTIDLDPGVNTSLATTSGQYDAFICKLDQYGNYIWSKNWGSTSDDACNEISLDSYGNVYYTGSFQSTTDFDPSIGISNLTATCTIANGNTDMYISKLFSNGNFGWVKRIGGSGITVGNSLTIENNNLYTTGLFKETTDFNPDLAINTLTSTINSNNDAFILKLSSATTCIQPNLTITGLGCVGSPITLTSDTGIAQIQWYLNGNLISTQQGWSPNGVTVAGGNGAGSAFNQLDVPIAVYVDSAKNLFIAETTNNRIVKWANGSTSGTIVAGGNGAGSASNQLRRPTDIVMDKFGFMYISDYENQRVVKWRLGSTSGITIAGGNGFGSSSTQFYNPMGLDVDTLGNVYVSDAVNGRIQKFLPGSTSTTPGITVVSGLSNSFDVKLDDSLNIFNSDWGTGTIKKSLNGQNNPTSVANGLIYPSGVFVDKVGNVYASNQNAHKIEKWVPGATTGIVIAGGNGLGSAANQLAYPQKIFLDKSGNLYVADGNNLRIQKYSLRNSFTFTPATTGTYTAIVTLFNGCSFASNSVVVSNANILPDTTKTCGDSVAILNVASGYSSYQWSNGAVTNSITVSQNGMYNVTVTSPNGCISKDSSYVSIINAQILNNDTSICRGDSLVLSASYRTSPVYDNSGNRYETVNIGTQIWTKSNLNTAKYNNGSSITKVTNATQWNNSTTGAWCWYNNDSVTYSGLFGKLYNNYAIQDSRGLVPAGWHIPSDQDFSILENYLGGSSVAGGKLKAISNLWQSPNTGASNTSDFSALPGGERDASGNFFNINQYGSWWTNGLSGGGVYNRMLDYNSTRIRKFNFYNYKYGFSIRFLRDTILNYSYVWSNGTTSQTISVSPTQTTTYYCTISNGITSCIDSVTITVGINPFQDTTKICGDSTVLDAGAGYAQYSWNTGDTTRTIVVRNSGFYKVTVTNIRGCSSSDSTYVSLLSARIIQNDTTVCRGSSITLSLQVNLTNLVRDIDGNIYPIISIGNQTWLQKNLNTSKYKNGDDIPHVTNPNQWINLTTGAWCWYNNDSANYAATYGKLYNWFAVTDPRGLVPQGWHSPSINEWTTLTNYLGGVDFAGGKMKEQDTIHWLSPNQGATNSSLFTALPGGFRGYQGNFYNNRLQADFWSSTPSNQGMSSNSGAWYTLLYNNLAAVGSGGNFEKYCGLSVRGVSDVFSSTIYQWSTGDTSLTINVSPQQTTSYYATVSNGINSCVDSVKITISILDTSITVLDSSSTICSNNGSVRLQAGVATSYQWLFNGVPIPNSNSRVDTARQSGSYRVVVTNNLGCSDTSRAIQVNIYSLPQTPVLTANGPTTFCSTSNVTLSTTSTNVTYQWYKNGTPVVSGTTSSLIVNQSGQYTVGVTNANGCRSISNSITILVNQLPAASISYSGTPFCTSLTTAQAVTRTGTTGGTYSASPAGLSINSTTGSITPSASTAGTYTVTYTIAASNGCSAVTPSTSVTITAQPSATISYSGPYCRSLTIAQPVTRTGTNGGVYTSSPAGLSINSSTGAITPSASTAGTYTVTYTIAASNGCTAYIAPSTSVTITAQPSATISYSSPFCNNVTTAQAAVRVGTTGGTYSATPAGLSINSTTGAIIPSASTASTYTVTYTIAASNGCLVYTAPSTSVTINAQPNAAISYSGSPFCRSLTTAQPVTRTGNIGGVYTSTPAGLSINSSTGAITPSASTAGTYTVTYTIPASNGCGVYIAPSTSITISTQPSATIAYASPYCRSVTAAQPVTRTGTAGGIYSATPAGLSINVSTGAITPSASTAGTYAVTYTIPASNGCLIYTAPATTVTITSQPSATISYNGSPYCRTVTTAQPVIRTGTAGGTFSSTPAGLSINSSTGAITPSLSTAGTYTVNYSVPASGGCLVSTFQFTPVVISSTLPIGNITPSSGNICEGSTFSLSASGGNIYQWFKNGTIITGATSSTYPASTAGTYTVQIFSSNGCNAMGSNSSVLTFTKKPIADFRYNSFCINKPITFTSTSDTANSRPVTYSWNFGDGVGTSSLMNPNYTYRNPRSYDVALTVRPTRCPSLQSTITKTISIDSFIANVRYPNANAVVPPGLQLNAREFTPAASYAWSPSIGLNSTNIYNPYFNTNTPQQYIITITSTAGCIIKDTLQVNVFTTQDIFVPKGFSPNNDGANDKLFPFLVGIRTFNYFQVYNRWGQKVFETNVEGVGWDGRYRGVVQPIETYTWIAEGIGLDGKVVKRSGGTLLMR